MWSFFLASAFAIFFCSSDKKLIIYLSSLIISSYKSDSLSRHHNIIGGLSDNDVYEFIVIPRLRFLELLNVIAVTPVANLLKTFLKSLLARSSIELSNYDCKV